MDNCSFCNSTDHPPESCPATLLDYTGEQVRAIELLERLKYRQSHFAEFQRSGGRVMLELNVFVCTMGHTQPSKRLLIGPCKICKTAWMFRIRKGILEDMGGRVLAPHLASSRVEMIGQNIRFIPNKIPKIPGPKRGPGRPKGALGRPRKEVVLDQVAGVRRKLRPATKFTENGVKRNSKWNTGRKRTKRAGVPRWQYFDFMNEKKEGKK